MIQTVNRLVESGADVRMPMSDTGAGVLTVAGQASCGRR